MRTDRRAWALCLFTCLCVAAYVGLYATSGFDIFSPAGVEEGFPVLPVAVVLGAVVGALILSRYPRHRIGWLLSIGQAGTGLGLGANGYGYRVLTGHEFGPPTAGHVAAWVSHLFGTAYALPLTFALFLLVPDGRLLSRRWRLVMAALIGSYLLYAVVLLVAVPARHTTIDLDGTPMSPQTVELLNLSGTILLGGALAAALAAVLRLRRAAPAGWVP